MSEREERMKPVLDRIPEQWGKYLPRSGWDEILLDLDRRLAEIDPSYAILQAKEKFGELRFYPQWSRTLSTDESGVAHGMIIAAVDMSNHTCEYCGAAGAKARYTGWVKTLCDDCHEAREKS